MKKISSRWDEIRFLLRIYMDIHGYAAAIVEGADGLG
jgi:hypothetical protein